MDDRRVLFKIISELMNYPVEGFMERLPGVRTASGELPRGVREKIQDFISGISSESLIRVQESYTAAFYIDSNTTLNMTYHRWGNGEKRAQVLAQLERVYREAGYERVDGELPDFLPLILEFLSINPHACGMELFRQCLSGAETVRAELRMKGSRYAGLLEIVACILREVEGEDCGSCS